ncbi:MAG: LysM peptidoglycan-binding domain-containing protein [Bacilli bacterium]|nr:LysM peptidoglycan-binding domain-containing protein [Bacilli bacterium]
MNNLKVVIDAGHGGTDSGAVSGNIKEKDLTLMISKYMLEQFKNKGIDSTLIRNTDESISPAERTKRILDAYGDKSNVIIISNHINASGGEGAEVIYALRDNSNLAKNILTSLGNAGQKMRKYFQRRLPSNTSKDYYFIHRNTGQNTKPVIVEYGFIDNPKDLAKIQENYKKYVDAVVDAVIKTYEGKTIENLPSSGKYYTVKSGDSLWKIAKENNTTVDEIKKLNNLKSNNLVVGQTLKLSEKTNDSDKNDSDKYIVTSGDSLWKIANQYGLTVNQLKQLNNLTSDNLEIGQELKIKNNIAKDETNVYTVKSGDSLWKIANQYGLTVNQLKQLNNLTSDNLEIGQKLKIKNNIAKDETNIYTVKAGDSLWNIANRFKTNVNELKKLNNLTNNYLTIGQTLKIPTTD